MNVQNTVSAETKAKQIVPIAIKNAREMTADELKSVGGGVTASGSVTYNNGKKDASATIDGSF